MYVFLFYLKNISVSALSVNQKMVVPLSCNPLCHEVNASEQSSFDVHIYYSDASPNFEYVDFLSFGRIRWKIKLNCGFFELNSSLTEKMRDGKGGTDRLNIMCCNFQGVPVVR